MSANTDNQSGNANITGSSASPYVSSTSDMPASVNINTQRGGQRYIMEVQRTESFSGPLPSPEILKGYSEVIPDAPERLLRMAERQNAHDMEMDQENMRLARRSMDRGFNAARRGQILGFILGIILIGCGVYLTKFGFESVGLVIFSTSLVAVIANFVTPLLKKGDN